ncbi:MAG TPA: hypothetical protein VMN60_07270, partial [Longimicrobiales bacterium]|nr:hypothetical protein [Longimicrobiales bacterium]
MLIARRPAVLAVLILFGGLPGVLHAHVTPDVAADSVAVRRGTAVAKTWDGGAATANWGDGANWSPDGVPTSADDVTLGGANTININVAATTRDLLLNNAGLTLTVNAGFSLAVSGSLNLTAGIFNTAAAFPTVTGTVNVAGGTVGFTGAGAQTIPAYSYNSLTLANAGVKTFSAGTTGVAATLSITGTATANATTNATTISYNGS